MRIARFDQIAFPLPMIRYLYVLENAVSVGIMFVFKPVVVIYFNRKKRSFGQGRLRPVIIIERKINITWHIYA